MTVQTLAGKEIVLGVTGSIAAVETIKLVHALIRKGARVQPVMSEAARGIIHPDALTYASGRQTVTRLSGLVEHVTHCGDGGSAALLLIAPCTANTIGKIAAGIDDTPVTTFATTALGSGIPVLVVPAMHHSMYRHPAVVRNIKTLKSWGIGFIDPRIEEEKAKIADIDEIVLRCEREVMGKPLAGKTVLITSGACREPVDDVRILTTRSSGRMGQELALEAFRLGAEVTIVHRDTIPCAKNIRIETASDMREAVGRCVKEKQPDIYISAAAISDFAPERIKGKIPSGAPVSLDLTPLPKLLDTVLGHKRTRVIAFKIGKDTTKDAHALLKRGAGMVVTNTPASMGTGDGNYRLVTKGSPAGEPVTGTKDEIARIIWQEIVESFLPQKDP
ncbi:MAG: bifunctional phosphopantothenoylcysteine decarboxylase/phosphopantothenate--cysteine ligase CoaBC [Methanoregula sp.]|nr:bifunctional phosphopantothenoylcysteine decarboxylase/phosphopantothenate--cysteine ligase CoaBC [Methanoregula sp.]